MRNKIYKNREVLRNLPVDVTLCGDDYEFKIIYVNEKVIKIGITLYYNDMLFADSNSLDGIVKKVILETSSNNAPVLSRQAFLSKHKLKKVDVIVDGIEFKIDTVTNSNLMLAKSIGYHELLNSNDDGFFESIRNTVEDNLLENPPKIKNNHSSVYAPDVFYPWGYETHFQEIGESVTVVSEAQLEKNRKKFKKESEEGERNREKMKKLDKELGLDKKSDTRELARFR